MSRIWKLPVAIPTWVTVNLENDNIIVTWPKWNLNYTFRPEMEVKFENDNIIVERRNDEKLSMSLHGLTRTLIANMVIWVTTWFEKKLQILWVWYSYKIQWSEIVLALGFSHPVTVKIWEWINVQINEKKKDILLISWIDKQKVWEFAAQVRKLKKPEPYKWKWIRYLWEYVRKKAWKAAAKK